MSDDEFKDKITDLAAPGDTVLLHEDDEVRRIMFLGEMNSPDGDDRCGPHWCLFVNHLYKDGDEADWYWGTVAIPFDYMAMCNRDLPAFLAQAERERLAGKYGERYYDS